MANQSKSLPRTRGNATRREFIQTGTAVGASALATTVLPASVLGRDGAVAPNDRIVLAGIGIGNRGTTVLRWMLVEPDVQFVAICDPKKERRVEVKALADSLYDNDDCKMYSDIREFLALRTDIDAVLIATGDRWHATAACMAMRAGKDVYSEKPSSMTIAEGQAVVDTAKRYGRIYQTGTQRTSEANFVFCDEMLRLGKLGNVSTVRAHIAPWDAAEMRHDWLPEEPLPPKEEVDWDQWLGPCPWRPYNKLYVQGRWRGHYDFHTSCIGEWGAHTFAQCQVGMNAGDTSAVSYGYVENESGDGMVTTFDNGIDMVLERDMDKKYWQGSCGVRYEGDEGWVASADGYEKPDVSDPRMLEQFDTIVNEYRERTGRAVGDSPAHARNFLDCIHSREETVANPEVMHRSMSTVHAANICMWLKRDLRFDPVAQDFPDDPEASRLCTRAQRAPWTI